MTRSVLCVAAAAAVAALAPTSLAAQFGAVRDAKCANVLVKPPDPPDTSGTADTFARWAEDGVAGELRSRYEYALGVSTLGDLRTMIDVDRQRQLLGAGSSDLLDKVAGLMSPHYFVLLSLSRGSGSYTLSASMVRGHDYRFLVQRTYGIPATSAGLNAINAAARDFVTEMGYARELCPFQGPISVHKVETRKTDRTSTGSVFCNGDWRDLTRAHHVNLSDDQRWRVERRGRSGGGPGTLQWRVSDVTQDVEDHGCYACKAGSLGRRTSDRTVTLTTEVDGVSRTSTAVDTSLWDVRATIEFRRDSTYTIFVRAASSTGLARRNVSHVVSGACDTDGEKDDGTAKRSAPLELRLGPFRGTPFDARLQGKGRLDAQKTDEAERYIDFDFNLRRLK